MKPLRILRQRARKLVLSDGPIYYPFHHHRSTAGVAASPDLDVEQLGAFEEMAGERL
ncbi:hypothetical protein G5V57_03155 [Nordella sp. HKS 07]|uniref:hypothetical protein n=1 Tax=Nordella sp. HKS 07 TaxID=2712222 RepID=UPI0013E14183|nr:hypothetical protein [Nordella sp. HKS 07]QIG46830.1 hypothetical protein G5V57_03155 [Nordella sp. HKS 07]